MSGKLHHSERPSFTMAQTSTLSFKCALITGGSGGLGLAMAKSLIRKGKKVIIAGRTESKLKAAADEIGAAGYYTLDTGKVADIKPFIEKLLSEHPDVDCLINNAGVQRPFQILGPTYGFDLEKADQELDINIRGPMHLTVGLVEHFNSQPNGAVVMNVSSVLGFNPVSIINPVYNGTKAWVHMFTMNLRSQLTNAGSKIKVVEIVPPTVETDLHREREDPDDNKKSKGNQAALSLDDFIKDVEAGWNADEDTVAAGPGKDVVKRWYDAYKETYNKSTK